MKYQDEYEQQQTLLNPASTRIEIEGWLTDERYLYHPNSYGEYVVKFQPMSNDDMHRFFEMAERCKMEVEMLKGPHSSKIAANSYEDSKGCPYASQLFKPYLDINEEKYQEWYHRSFSNQPFTIKGHFRDTQDGRIYFQIDYLDVTKEVYSVSAPVTNEDVDDDDW